MPDPEAHNLEKRLLVKQLFCLPFQVTSNSRKLGSGEAKFCGLLSIQFDVTFSISCWRLTIRK